MKTQPTPTRKPGRPHGTTRGHAPDSLVVQVAFRIDADTQARIDAARGKMPAADWLREAVRRHLVRHGA